MKQSPELQESSLNVKETRHPWDQNTSDNITAVENKLLILAVKMLPCPPKVSVKYHDAANSLDM